MIKKVFIIWWWNKTDINDDEYKLLESDFLEWNIKNQSYGLMITKAFIDEFWKDNVINCLVKGKWEYRNIFWYKGYRWKFFVLLKELWKNRKESIFMFHGMYPRILIYSLIPTKHKCRRRHAIIWPYNKCENKVKWIMLWLIQKVFQNFMDTIFYVNDNEKKELINYKYKWNIFFLPIPINTEFWYLKKENVNQKKNIIISSTWSICNRKNQKIIVEAIKLVNKSERNIHVNIIWPGMEKEYTTQIKTLSKWFNINFNGNKSARELREIYKNTDIYIQASFSEWLCQTYIEACLSWCPLILSNIPTFTETAKDYALFFDPLNVKDLSEKIIYMIDHLDEYKEKSRKLAEIFKRFWYESFNKQFKIFICLINKDV